ncbi:MAG: hypothetical protein VKJ04_08150 [Vampirovibrionales bacterium]|nr:hypothetical protein [Vampirovibrionales bacterium]
MTAKQAAGFGKQAARQTGLYSNFKEFPALEGMSFKGYRCFWTYPKENPMVLLAL